MLSGFFFLLFLSRWVAYIPAPTSCPKGFPYNLHWLDWFKINTNIFLIFFFSCAIQVGLILVKYLFALWECRRHLRLINWWEMLLSSKTALKVWKSSLNFSFSHQRRKKHFIVDETDRVDVVKSEEKLPFQCPLSAQIFIHKALIFLQLRNSPVDPKHNSCTSSAFEDISSRHENTRQQMESLLNNVAWTEVRGFGFLYMLVTHSSKVQSSRCRVALQWCH